MYNSLKNSAEFLNTVAEHIFDRSQILLLVINANGSLEYANQRSIDIFPEPIEEKFLSDLFVDFSSDLTIEKLSEETETKLLSIQTKDNRPISYLFRFKKLSDGNLLIFGDPDCAQIHKINELLFESVNEISNLTRDVQKSNTELKKLNDIKNKYNTQLEEEVKARTEQLVEKNIVLENEIEERKKAENELKLATSQLVQTEKLATIGQLAAGVAHEINNPLGAISSSSNTIKKCFEKIIIDLENNINISNCESFLISDIIEKIVKCKFDCFSRENRQIKRDLKKVFTDYEIENPSSAAALFTNIGLAEDYQRYISLLQKPNSSEIIELLQNIYSVLDCAKIIDTAINQSCKVVNALRNFARSDESSEIIRVDIKETMDSAIVLYANKIKHGIDLILNLEEVPKINCYPEKLCQVWTNLIQNAIQAMSGKGKLSISVQQERNEVVVKVSDSGSGIPKDIQDRIFEPFFTTKAIGEGTGLGLDIVKRIIELHSGTISVESIEGKGTTFIVSIPIEIN